MTETVPSSLVSNKQSRNRLAVIFLTHFMKTSYINIYISLSNWIQCGLLYSFNSLHTQSYAFLYLIISILKFVEIRLFKPKIVSKRYFRLYCR